MEDALRCGDSGLDHYRRTIAITRPGIGLSCARLLPVFERQKVVRRITAMYLCIERTAGSSSAHPILILFEVLHITDAEAGSSTVICTESKPKSPESQVGVEGTSAQQDHFAPLKGTRNFKSAKVHPGWKAFSPKLHVMDAVVEYFVIVQ